jgi:hypothetical protein
LQLFRATLFPQPHYIDDGNDNDNRAALTTVGRIVKASGGYRLVGRSPMATQGPY